MKKNLILLIMIIFINIIASLSSDFASWYAKNISKIFINTLGRLFSIFPFSVFEWLVIALIIGLLVIIFKYRSLTLTLRFLLILVLFFSLTTGINYHRKPLETEMNFTRLTYNNDDLKNLANYLTTKLETANISELDEQTIKDTAKIAINQIIPGYYPNAKPMFFSNFMTVCNLSGIFSPFTIEANYNQKMPTYNKPFSICHELSHLAGYMSEDEANFLGYLACIKSDNSYFNYSGYLTAFIYVNNALRKNGQDISEYYDRLPQTVIDDLTANNEFWNQYGDFLSSLTNTVNDAYLKINSVSEGTNSYSMFVDLLYSYSKAENLF